MKWDWLGSMDRGEWPEYPSPRESHVGFGILALSIFVLAVDRDAHRWVSYSAVGAFLGGWYVAKFGFEPPWGPRKNHRIKEQP